MALLPDDGHGPSVFPTTQALDSFVKVCTPRKQDPKMGTDRPTKKNVLGIELPFTWPESV